MPSTTLDESLPDVTKLATPTMQQSNLFKAGIGDHIQALTLLGAAIFTLLISSSSCASKVEGGKAAEQNEHQHNSAPAKLPDAASAQQASINTLPAPGPPPEGMIWIPGGTFWMGCAECEMPDTLPVHLVTVDGYWLDKTPLTNAEFAKFVQATKYLTIAERKPDPKDFPGADPKLLEIGRASCRERV